MSQPQATGDEVRDSALATIRSAHEWMFQNMDLEEERNLEEAVRTGRVTIRELVAEFERGLRETTGLGELEPALSSDPAPRVDPSA